MTVSWGTFGNKLIERAKLKGVPLLGQFELTSRCNLRCKMCYVCQANNDNDLIKREMSAAKWINLAEQVRDAGTLYLLLTGGEVFLRPDFRTIYEEIAKMGFSTTIYSNATLITPEIAKWLGRIPPFKLSVTMYGASSETYQRVCGSGDGYEKALRGVELLMAEGINIELKTTVVRGNINDFTKLGELAKKLDIDFSVVNYITPRREGEYTDPVGARLSPEELIDFELCVDKFFKENMKRPSIAKSDEECLIKDSECKVATLIPDYDDPFACPAGKAAFWVTWDGRMAPCGLISDPITYPFEDGFINEWERLKELTKLVPGCKECKSCSVKNQCSPCPARLVTETGSYDKPAPYLCELAHKRVELARTSEKECS